MRALRVMPGERKVRKVSRYWRHNAAIRVPVHFSSQNVRARASAVSRESFEGSRDFLETKITGGRKRFGS